jgi:predicted lipoprotein with Yx(FWY)xxD motif
MKPRGSRVILIAVAGLLAVTAFAIAKSTTVGVGTAEVKGHQEPVAVNGRGVTIYELAPESTRHLVCTSTACLSVWPPVKANGKITAASGVTGRLGTVKRKGFTQVTLNGHPVYTFSEDNGRRGKAEGEGLRNFGGVWHVFHEG